MRRLILLCSLLVPASAFACGPNTDCVIGDRTYRIALPETQNDEPIGAIVFAHGYRGSAQGTMRNKNLREMASDMGLALIAVKSYAEDWQIPNVPADPGTDGHIEYDYFDAVITDATTRFAIDADRIMMTGFSAGGMMVWELICNRPDLFAGFAPIAGTFWLSPPATCAESIASVIHIHGTEDKIVPLTGRPIGPTHQGNVFEALEMHRAKGDFGPVQTIETSGLRCDRRSNASGAILDFCTFAGGHAFKLDFLRYAWSRLEEVGQL